MAYKYAVLILRKAAFELGGEILTNRAIEHEVETAGDVHGLAHQILFGSFSPHDGEKEVRFLELIRAIKLLDDIR